METFSKESKTDILVDYETSSADREPKISLIEAMRIVTDEYSNRILIGSSKEPLSALELSHMFNIPLAACYRRIRLLKKAGILNCTMHISRGKKVNLYTSSLDRARIYIENGRFRIKFEMGDGTVTEIEGNHISH